MAAEENERSGRKPPRKPRSKEDPREAKARYRARSHPSARPADPRTDEPATPGESRPGPARQPNPLPDQARHAPLLRANPYSEVTDPICRLPLPTLFYRLEALYLGDLLRIWVRTGATAPRGPLLDFQGPRGKIRTPPQLRCSSRSKPYLPAKGFHGCIERLCRKENSSRISRRRLQVILGYPDEHSCESPNFKRFRCRVPE